MRSANTRKPSGPPPDHGPVSPHPRRHSGPDGTTPLVILHGLLGSSDNWQTLGARWAETRPVVLIDQRNHGRSPHHPSHTYPDMVVDLLDTLDALGIERADLLGHSMGGKTVMHFADRHPSRCRRLIVADMAPIAYPPHHTPLFDALSALDLNAFARRPDVDAALAERVPEAGIRQFLLKGLHRATPDRFAWRYNLPVLRRHLADMTAFMPLAPSTVRPWPFTAPDRTTWSAEGWRPSRPISPTSSLSPSRRGTGCTLNSLRPFHDAVAAFLS